MEDLLDLLDPSGKSPHESLFLGWPGAHELVRRGFSIGSHSMYHSILSRETTEVQVAELKESRTQLAEELGLPINLLAYPNGTPQDHDLRTVAAARAAGYKHAFCTQAGFNSPSTDNFERPRFMLRPDSPVSTMLIRGLGRRLRYVDESLVGSRYSAFTFRGRRHPFQSPLRADVRRRCVQGSCECSHRPKMTISVRQTPGALPEQLLSPSGAAPGRPLQLPRGVGGDLRLVRLNSFYEAKETGLGLVSARQRVTSFPHLSSPEFGGSISALKESCRFTPSGTRRERR